MGAPQPDWADHEWVLVSALNEYLYCPRRCALHHLEGEFAHNEYTLAGLLEHEHADTPGAESGSGVRVVRALPLFSRRLGLVGKADVVEFHGRQACPVEYKHGKRRQWDNDDVQVCAQALCLEEMLGQSIPLGYVFHSSSQHRREVPLDDALRQLTEDTVLRVRELIAGGQTPEARLCAKCPDCSLHSICLPEASPAELRQRPEALNPFKV